MKQHLRKRKILLVMPLLVIPFLTLAFYALGGGQVKREVKEVNELNLKLPTAVMKDEEILDKLGFYDKAKNDSLKLAELMRSDPFFMMKDSIDPEPDEFERLTEEAASKYNQQLSLSPLENSRSKPEEELVRKLKALQEQLDKNPGVTRDLNKVEYKQFDGDVERMEKIMNSIQNEGIEDQEINQLSSVMDKILDVQHPERVKERNKEKLKQETTTVNTVRNRAPDDTIAFGFYGISSEAIVTEPNSNLAVVHENQILVNGGIIKLRLLKDLFINNEKIPAGNFIFGTVSLNGERLEVKINSIRSGNSVFDVSLEVYDMDGLPGIHIPGAITRDVAKQSADNNIQMMEFSTLDPSLKAQATTAGIGTLKNLLKKKVKLVKVMVKAGYKVLLRNKS